MEHRTQYEPPRLEEFGTVTDLTKVGQTNPGSDALPGQAKGNANGSVFPPGLSGGKPGRGRGRR